MTMHTSRRGFLKGAGAVAASALIIGVSPAGALAQTDQDGGNFTPFVKITPDGQVTAILKHFEMGQGTTTGLTTLIAEELGVDLDDIAIEFAPSDSERYGNIAFGGMQGTGGSTAIFNSFMQYRQAGAAARDMLLKAAADKWGVDFGSLTLDSGMISGAGKKAPLAEFVEAAVKLEVPKEPKLKDPSAFKFIGNPNTSRRDNVPKTNGTAMFAMDVHLDNQIVAVIKRSPRFGGKFVSMNADAAKSVPGFINAVPMPNGAGVIVYGKNTWAAIQAREAVTAEWDFSKAENRSSDQIKAELMAAVDKAPEFNAKEGSDLSATEAALKGAAQVVEQVFYFPYLAHAMMEPLNCTIEPTADGGVMLHDGCQFPVGAHPAIATVLKLPKEKVKINTLYAGGSFGRRATLTADYHVEAAIAFAMVGGKQPVKLVWTREDDLAGGAYRPAYVHKVSVGLDDAGKIVAWDHRVAGQSLFKGTPFENFTVKNGVDRTSVEGINDTPYAIPNQFVGLTDFKTPITVNWLRSVGHTHTAHVMECMMDMAAKAAGVDPVDYRLSYLTGDEPNQKRLTGVLKLAAEKSGWGDALPAGRSRGVAVHKSFNSYVAEVAEISRDADGAVRIEKITCAVDCGIAVNPDVVKAQMEGGIGYGLGFVMRDEITFENGEVEQQNFPDYEPLRIGDIGAIETFIVPSAEAPTGVGEPGTPPAGPAVANAIAADGPRVTILPMANKGVTFA